ncbi:hypothetical protein IE53DRAFT_199947 [Violaceomyces palustris]|uniref:Uncharacterized protein n=1 Tax=Violaceomyces palustris TaxID=1673888 RepID=A0ACD0NRD8_9BASI|nr:hypothetical protein IE53DRAFT_199947 [Violaceomyces palustris]
MDGGSISLSTGPPTQASISTAQSTTRKMSHQPSDPERAQKQGEEQVEPETTSHLDRPILEADVRADWLERNGTYVLKGSICERVGLIPVVLAGGCRHGFEEGSKGGLAQDRDKDKNNDKDNDKEECNTRFHNISESNENTCTSARMFELFYRDYGPVAELAETIVKLYEVELKHSPKEDGWLSEGGEAPSIGRGLFKNMVSSFVEAGEAIAMVIPAFPGKSSNKEKTSGILPDKGEELALRTLLQFSCSVERFYPPGCIFHVVSDGHVFSDLVGVDDSVIDLYGKEFRRLAKAIDGELDGHFRFYDLAELLPIPSLEKHAVEKHLASIQESRRSKGSNVPSKNRDETITEVGWLDDLRRESLIDLYGKQDLKMIDGAIKNDATVRRLYTGFTKFVLEDLRNHESRRHLSTSAQRKKSKLVARRMIQRNDAYSRLVEICFPDVIRLSIHPHNNRGPKFGINLIHRRHLGGEEEQEDRAAFHIPTPWHNTVLGLDDREGQEGRLNDEGCGKRFMLLKVCEMEKHRPKEGACELVFRQGDVGAGSGGFYMFERRC